MKYKNIIFMKYGVHASEDVDGIINRKLKEIEDTGKMFWGYGGTVCHPLNQVKPFLNENKAKGEKTYLVLSYTKSNFNNKPNKSELYSMDKIEWNKIPDGINVLGSKYALICKSFKKVKHSINLEDYNIAIGPSTGKKMSQYIKGRIDKGCGRYENKNSNDKDNNLEISLIAEIQDVVFVK